MGNNIAHRFSTRLLDAIYFATKKHNGQTRKDGVTPYIEHPMSVALIASRVSKDEDILIAALLHDVLEDTNTTPEEIQTLFGNRVTKLVVECTDDRSLPWKKRKLSVLEKIKDVSSESALIKSADILHNTYELMQKVHEHGPSFMKKFNATPQDKLWYDNERLKRYKKYHPNPLLKEIESNLGIIKQLVEKFV
jgi:(p)ppGpp synthase/HD superfamily hydrolase